MLNHLEKHRFFYISVLVIFLFGLALLPAYQYQINPDGISYIGIAQKYARGDFRHAINGYWGPLLSWLMVPGILLSFNPILTIKFIQLLTVVGIMTVTYLTLKELVEENYLTRLAVFLVGLVSLNWAFTGPLTPDLLVCLLSLTLVYIAAKLTQPQHIYSLSIIFGGLGALLYFSKSVGFYLFGCIWLIVALLRHVQYKKKHFSFNPSNIRYTIVSLLTFALLVLPFVATISLKYRQPTIGTSGAYNFALNGPHTIGHPMLSTTIEPPNSTAISIWEDISRVKIVNWNPVGSPSNVGHLFTIVYKNLSALYMAIPSVYWLLLPLALMFILLRDNRPFVKQYKTLILLFCLINMAAYLPIFIEARYLIVVLIAAIIGSVSFAVLNNNKLFKGFVTLVYICVAASCIVTLQSGSFMNMDIYNYSNTLKPVLNSNIRIASDNFTSLYACYYTGAKCLGTIDPNSKDLMETLEKQDIDYLLLWPKSAGEITSHGLSIGIVENSYYEGQFLYKVPAM